jgi:hypothetical protein
LTQRATQRMAAAVRRVEEGQATEGWPNQTISGLASFGNIFATIASRFAT